VVTIEQVFNLIEIECGVNHKELTPDTDIFNDLGVEGDDFSELIEKYASNFNVNMNDYLWYFHSNDEGTNVWSFLFKPPNKKVNRIPVTPKLLLDAANSKKWNLNYPPHNQPKNRSDLTYSNILWGIILLGLFLVVRYT
jgi:hypothetical protein